MGYGECGEVVNTAVCGIVIRGFESRYSPHFFIMKYISKSKRETQNIARIILKENKDKNLFILIGSIGYGKTEFVKGFAKELGETEIKSPTFTIKSEYENMIHYDIYNSTKHDHKSLLLMIEEDLEEGKKVIVEWGDKISALTNFDPLIIKIDVTDEEIRTIEVK